MSTPEVELRFHVPAASRRALSAELERIAPRLQRLSLSTLQLDTPDRRLSQAGLSWQLRREGRRWVQALKTAGSHQDEGFEHLAIRTDATADPAAHAGTLVGRRLAELLQRASEDGLAVEVCFKAQVRRTRRPVRARGAVVEVAHDQGHLEAGALRLVIDEVSFEKASGSTPAMFALAERWRARFGLVLEPRSQAQRGDALAAGLRHPPVRKAGRVNYDRDAGALQALDAVVGDCLAQISSNAIGLVQGDLGQQVDHVHQLRVGIRRLRSALRSFEAWTPAPPASLLDGLKLLFAELGRARDADVLAGGVAAALARAGAPALALPGRAPGTDPAQLLRDGSTQQLLLAWIAWRQSIAEPAKADSIGQPRAPSTTAARTSGPARTLDAAPSRPAAGQPADVATVAGDSPPGTPHDFHRAARRRLRRWHRRIVRDLEAFDELDEPALHALRKRIKRQRYAVEFFMPLLRRRSVNRYVKPLAEVQEHMGQLNDLYVARARYEALVKTDPAAWFALGWISARVAELRARVRRHLARLAEAEPPTR